MCIVPAYVCEFILLHICNMFTFVNKKKKSNNSNSTNYFKLLFYLVIPVEIMGINCQLSDIKALTIRFSVLFCFALNSSSHCISAVTLLFLWRCASDRYFESSHPLRGRVLIDDILPCVTHDTASHKCGECV